MVIAMPDSTHVSLINVLKAMANSFQRDRQRLDKIEHKINMLPIIVAAIMIAMWILGRYVK